MPPPEDWDKHQGHSRILYSPDNMKKKREGRRNDHTAAFSTRRLGFIFKVSKTKMATKT